MRILKKFYIHYEYGMHHLDIETTEKDFYQIIDDLSTEFQIHRDEDCDNKYITYWIINYCGEKTTIGYYKYLEIE